MWIFTPIGFFSAVQKPWDKERDTITVRSRARVDLERLKAKYIDNLEITESDDSDYRYRAVVSRLGWAEAVAAMAEDIDYSNFKDAASKIYPDRALVYGMVWSVLTSLEG